MRLRFKDLGCVLNDAFQEWLADNCLRLGAALAYYAMFSIAPLLLISMAVAGLVYGQDAAEGRIAEQLENMVGHQAAVSIQSLLTNTGDPGTGVMATIIGIMVLFVGATGVVVALKEALNIIWGVAPDPDRGWFTLFLDRVWAFIVVLGAGLLLLASVALTAILSFVSKFALQWIPVPLPVAYLISHTVSFAVLVLLFAMIFKILPDVKIQWSDVWIGATLTAFLFLIGKELIAIYLGYAGINLAYGAASSLAIVLIWTYYSALIFFLGAEFTQVYARATESPIRPSIGAIPQTEALEKEHLNERKQWCQDVAPPE